MDIIHEYGVFCEYTVHYVLYYVDVCIIYSVDPSLLTGHLHALLANPSILQVGTIQFDKKRMHC